jgi:DNA-binding NtrC family response regulator
VLVVDDEPDITTALASYLHEGLGVEVLQANSGDAALGLFEQAGSAAVDLVINDFKMPGMDGLQLLRTVADLAPDVPRVLMTAYPDVDVAIQALNEGRILHFMSKPISPGDLRDVVAAILAERLARLQRDAALQRSLQELRRRRPADRGDPGNKR